MKSPHFHSELARELTQSILLSLLLLPFYHSKLIISHSSGRPTHSSVDLPTLVAQLSTLLADQLTLLTDLPTLLVHILTLLVPLSEESTRRVSSTYSPGTPTYFSVTSAHSPASSTHSPGTSTQQVIPLSWYTYLLFSYLCSLTCFLYPLSWYLYSAITSAHSPASSTHSPVTSAHSPASSTHSPVTSAHSPASSTHSPVTSAHSPASSTHSPVTSAHSPASSTHSPVTSAHSPASSTHSPVTSAHSPASSTHSPVTSAHSPASSTHSPGTSTQQVIPSPGNLTCLPVTSAHSPASSTHSPVTSAHSPASSTHSPGTSTQQVIPSPGNLTCLPVTSAHSPASSTHSPVTSAHSPASSTHSPGTSTQQVIPLSCYVCSLTCFLYPLSWYLYSASNSPLLVTLPTFQLPLLTHLLTLPTLLVPLLITSHHSPASSTHSPGTSTHYLCSLTCFLYPLSWYLYSVINFPLLSLGSTLSANARDAASGFIQEVTPTRSLRLTTAEISRIAKEAVDIYLQEMPKEEKKTEWTSIYLGSFLTFMAAAQFTLYFSSLFPYMKLLDKSTTETFFGLVISSYSLSQSIASPILGWWSNRIKRLKPALFICTFFMFAGNSLYFFVKLVPFHPKYVLMLARFIAGFGDSCIGLLKAYAACSKRSLSSNCIRYRSMALGTIFGPAFQLLFSWFGYPGLQVNSRFSVSMFNSPALFACATNILSFILLLTLFKESFVGVDDIEMSKESDSKCLPPYDRIAALICYCLSFSSFSEKLFRIGASFSIIMFSWTATEVVFMARWLTFAWVFFPLLFTHFTLLLMLEERSMKGLCASVL
uniref:Uncharacterized protein n=1 Tax=Ditylenchus dipsaci TaxID=166011 RepID=A0A915EP68_9BILA